MLSQREKAPVAQFEEGARSDAVVEVKYIGTASDQHDMEILGRKQVLRVSHRPPYFPFWREASLLSRAAIAPGSWLNVS